MVLHRKARDTRSKDLLSSDSDAGSATPAIIASEFNRLLSSRQPAKSIKKSIHTVAVQNQGEGKSTNA
jgi:hypothetical protein